MNAEDTVLRNRNWKRVHIDIESELEDQAEATWPIAYKEGIKEVVEWLGLIKTQSIKGGGYIEH
ncbi:hypothetical protein LCGC14_2715170, partial [marine sediment metagenome]